MSKNVLSEFILNFPLWKSFQTIYEAIFQNIKPKHQDMVEKDGFSMLD